LNTNKMPPKPDKKKKKEKGPKRRKLKRPLFSRFHIGLLHTEFLENFHKCDKDSDKLAAIPLEHLSKAMRMCGLVPSEKLVALIAERMEKQQLLRTPPPSPPPEEEEEEDDEPWLEEELEILKMLEDKRPSQVLKAMKDKKKGELEGGKAEGKGEGKGEVKGEGKGEGEEAHTDEEKEGEGKSRRKSKKERRKEEEERKRQEEEAERQRLYEEEKERLRLEEEEAERLRQEEEEKRKKKPKRELKWPYAKKKEEIKKVAKMRIRFKHFAKWVEFADAMQLYEEKQYTGQDILWAFMTLDPKWDYELEPTWYYGAEEPLVPTDEIDNTLVYSFIVGRQERFLEKEAKRFIRMADFKKETFFNYKELISDMCYEANYDMGKPKKKKKIIVKET